MNQTQSSKNLQVTQLKKYMNREVLLDHLKENQY